MKAVRIIVQVVLFVGIVALGYFIYDGVMKPIKFEDEKIVREGAVVERLKAIRTAQVSYKSVYGKYTGSFDTLIHFVKEDSFPVEYAEGSLDDSLAVAMGLIVRDTFYVSVKDSIFPDNYPVDSLRYVPFASNIEFHMAAASIMTASQVEVQVFEASAKYFDILNGMDRQLIINLNDLKEFPGVKVGNINEANNNAGNWE